MSALTSEQTKVHEHALYLAKRRRSLEAQLVKTLQEVDRLKVYKKLGKNSLFKYAVEILELDENIAYPLITVARKATVISELQDAIANKKLSVSKASRIVSSLKSDNAKELIQFAQTHTTEQINFEMAKQDPKSQSWDKMKALSEEWMELKMSISRSAFEKLKRAESLEAQRGNPSKWGDVMDVALEIYLEKNDPVRKAERAAKRREEKNEDASPMKPKLCLNRVKSVENKRIPPTAVQKRAVHLRDQGKCTHVGPDGKRCGQDRWTETHHIISVSQGGTNDPENLTTLCSFHHDLVHQLSLPIDGQITWLRSPRRAYG